ncbi:hypothetical protein [Streptomyces bullii]|uniref:Uncharacterized protein n=1 Tax=Streptomyces bullii TaxID=349910 RepID=A0ABW0UV83_9ACTN
MKNKILRRIAGRCDTHDEASPAKIRQLEQELGLTPTQQSGDLVDQLANPDLIDCGKAWCRKKRA